MFISVNYNINKVFVLGYDVVLKLKLGMLGVEANAGGFIGYLKDFCGEVCYNGMRF